MGKKSTDILQNPFFSLPPLAPDRIAACIREKQIVR
jgi:hypothetical protein